MSDNLFALSADYAEMLERGIRLSGEDQQYFIDGRISALRECLPRQWSPKRILDFGCGTGLTSECLAGAFPGAEVVGMDASEEAVAWAERTHGTERISFRAAGDLDNAGLFDLCYTNGVFHHIKPDERLAVLRSIRRSLSPQGVFALFENNPWNPGTRMVMNRIPFDRDAIPISPAEAMAIIPRAGFELVQPLRSLFYFPRPLAALRRFERYLTRLPMGAQYMLLASAGDPRGDRHRPVDGRTRK